MIYTAWGEPIRVDGFAPDGRWFGTVPVTVVSVDGEDAERLIPKIRSVIEKYKFSSYGDYRPWPGANSNTFVQAVLDAVPELKAVLPPTAIGKDYPYRGEWVGFTPSGTGVFATLGGYVGLTVGWVEGFELNFFGGVLGFDLRRPAFKFPGLGRMGMNGGVRNVLASQGISIPVEVIKQAWRPLAAEYLINTYVRHSHDIFSGGSRAKSRQAVAMRHSESSAI